MKERLEIPNEIFEYVKYDESSPSGLRWKKVNQYARNIKVGDFAGSKHKITGYWQIGFSGKLYLCHRVIYKLHHKINIQHTEIDHEDRDKDNNKIDNLRIATHNEQSYNRGIRSDNTSGIKGVCWDKNSNKFMARIWKNGKQHYLGLFEDISEAEKVVKKAREEMHKEFASHK